MDTAQTARPAGRHRRHRGQRRDQRLHRPAAPTREVAAGQRRDRAHPDQGETVGWPRFITTIATAWHTIPADERAHTAIFTFSYQEAGAIDVLGHKKRLPGAYSGHNGFSEWGKPTASDTHALPIGYHNPADAAHYFPGCRTLATVNNGVGLNNNEQGLPVMLCQPAAR